MFDSAEWNLLNFSLSGDRYSILIRRKGIKPILLLVLPIVLMNILVALVYVLPASSGERIGYSATLMLTFAVIMMQASTFDLPSSLMSLTGEPGEK